MIRGVLVTARCRSERMPNKCLLPFPDEPVIKHVLDRAQGLGMNVVLCTTHEPADDELAQLATHFGYEVYRGHPTNKIRRWADAVSLNGLDAVHLIDADDPFFDVCEAHDSLDWLTSEQLDLVRTSNRSDFGMASVGTSISASFLTAVAARVASLNSDDLDVIPWDLVLRDGDHVKIMPDRYLGVLDSNARLTLDYPEDYEMLLLLTRRFGPNTCRFRIERYLQENPAVSKVNLWRSKDFLARQHDQRAGFSGGSE